MNTLLVTIGDLLGYAEFYFSFMGSQYHTLYMLWVLNLAEMLPEKVVVLGEEIGHHLHPLNRYS
jgi:hypothetical protein